MKESAHNTAINKQEIIMPTQSKKPALIKKAVKSAVKSKITPKKTGRDGHCGK